MITIWLWDACSASGVTDGGPRAREAADVCLRAGSADTARVELALLVHGTSTMTMFHNRTGMGWSAQRYRNGRTAWKPLPISRDWDTARPLARYSGSDG